MKRIVFLLLVIAAIIALILFFRVDRGVPPRSEAEPEPTIQDTLTPTATASTEVNRVHTLLVNFLTAVKEPHRPPLGDNIDVVRALRGGNRYGDVFVATNDPSINSRGEWLDRWGTPYHFHARAADAIDVRSAGPDRILFTEDDVIHP